MVTLRKKECPMMKTNEIRGTAALKGDRGINKIAMTGLFAALSYVVLPSCSLRFPCQGETPRPST